MKFEHLIDRPIAFNRAFVHLGAGINGALMLSQAVYWSRRTKEPGGWFYKTREDWEDETGMTRTEQETARRNLRQIGVFEEQKRGVPCKVHYRVNFEELKRNLLNVSLQETCQLDGRKPANKNAGNLQTITETTTETTTTNLRDQQADHIPYAAIFQAYAEALPELPQLKLKDDARRKAIKGIWKLDAKFQTVASWKKYFAYVRESQFLMTANAIGFDWLLKPANFKKVIEGNYHGESQHRA